MEYFCANILLSGHWPSTRLKIFYFSALAAILFNGTELLRPSWIFDRHNFSLFWCRSHPVATEQVSAQSGLRFKKRCRKLIFKMAAVVAILEFSIGSFSNFVSHKRANALHQVSIQLDYRGDVQNINSQHFFLYKCIGPIQMHGKQIWPCRKKIKCQCTTIILALLVDLLSPRIYAKVRPKGLFGSGEENFKGF